MLSFEEFITESRSAPLYHATSFDRAQGILKQNTLEARQATAIGPKAISFTRNLKQALHHLSTMHSSVTNGVVFEVDQLKITQRYKIEPFQFWGASEYDGGSTTNKIKSSRVQRHEVDDETYNEFEERVLEKHITNFYQYINKVIIYSPDELQYLQKHPRYEYVFLNPKLYIYTTKKFVYES